MLRSAFHVLLLLLTPGLALAQAAQPPAPLSLQEAVAVALEKNPVRKAAMADQRAASAGVREARAALMPRITFSETATRGNDPVYVFGTRLRQQVFTPADFALNRLNTPTPRGNFITRFGGAWNVFDSFASWKNVARAQKFEQAAGQQLERTDQELVFRVVEAYYAILLADRQVEVGEQAERTAQAVLDRSKARYESGLVVEADLLSAQVNLANRQQQLIQARNSTAVAQAQLSEALGLTLETRHQPASPLSERLLPIAALSELEQTALQNRPDLRRLRSEESAQEQGLGAAKAAFGPRVNVFASWEADSPTFLAGGGGNNWLGGIELQFELFQGGAKAARVAREKALRERLTAMRQAAENGIRLEVRRAYYDHDAARRQLEVARAATAQAQESLRINQNRYESGLATITDLLRVEEAARRTQTDYWEAMYREQVSYARVELATGTLTIKSPVVTP